jgi:hypothetical protein
MNKLLRITLIQTILILFLMIILISSGCTENENEKNNADLNFSIPETNQAILAPPNILALETTPQAQIANRTPTLERKNISVQRIFYPTGYMGGTTAISMMKFSKNKPHSAPDCIMIRYYPVHDTIGWVGIYWQYPDNNWVDMKGYNLSDCNQLTFWARGEEGGEMCSFSMGGINGKKYTDSVNPAKSTGIVKLNKDWEKFSINLENNDLNNIIGGFCCVFIKDQNPNGCTIYLDDIFYE